MKRQTRSAPSPASGGGVGRGLLEGGCRPPPYPPPARGGGHRTECAAPSCIQREGRALRLKLSEIGGAVARDARGEIHLPRQVFVHGRGAVARPLVGLEPRVHRL